jgi:hypothetical protein
MTDGILQERNGFSTLDIIGNKVFGHNRNGFFL